MTTANAFRAVILTVAAALVLSGCETMSGAWDSTKGFFAGDNVKPVTVQVADTARASGLSGASIEVTLKVKATGKANKKLKKKGKAKVGAEVTFTPTGGEANTQTTKVKLKKK